MYSSITIANYFLRESWKEGIDITSMKLLKLVYIAHGWYLGHTGKRLVYDPICAWPYGPVIPELYFQINQYRGNPITATVTPGFNLSNEPSLGDSVIEFLNTILGHYNKFSAFDLSALTHQRGTPWDRVVRKYSSKELASRSILIPADIIRDYYKAKIEAVENINDE